jgi:hypothetical protein
MNRILKLVAKHFEIEEQEVTRTGWDPAPKRTAVRLISKVYGISQAKAARMIRPGAKAHWARRPMMERNRLRVEQAYNMIMEKVMNDKPFPLQVTCDRSLKGLDESLLSSLAESNWWPKEEWGLTIMVFSKDLWTGQVEGIRARAESILSSESWMGTLPKKVTVTERRTDSKDTIRCLFIAS